MELEFHDLKREDRNYRGKCLFLIAEIKKLDSLLGSKLKRQAFQTPEDETFELYRELVKTYRQLAQ